jgi:hypothetical protein
MKYLLLLSVLLCACHPQSEQCEICIIQEKMHSHPEQQVHQHGVRGELYMDEYI